MLPVRAAILTAVPAVVTSIEPEMNLIAPMLSSIASYSSGSICDTPDGNLTAKVTIDVSRGESRLLTSVFTRVVPASVDDWTGALQQAWTARTEHPALRDAARAVAAQFGWAATAAATIGVYERALGLRA